MQIQENISLRPYNTFGIDVQAKFFAEFSSDDELAGLLEFSENKQVPRLVLGGGSNILFTKEVGGIVLKNEIRGMEELHEDAEYIYVKAGAGETWHRFVAYCVERNWAGLENLSLIPGKVGASPIQNIGAYGVELRDVFLDLEAYHISDRKIYTFTNVDCEFGYRESVFKNQAKDQFIILSVTFRLRKHPVFHTSYGAIEQEMERMGVKELSIQAISRAVINIRSAKLPDPRETGNAGSFFKNPSVTQGRLQELKKDFPGIVAYENLDGSYKLAAGWLIEQCGWKGDAGCHDKQALVLVNYGHAVGNEIYDLSENIYISVKEKFGVELLREVNIF